MKFKTRDISFSPIKAIQERSEQLGAVSLAQGIPKFLPPLEVRRAAAEAIEQGKADFYGPARGLPELRKKISEVHLREEGAFYDPQTEVLATAGALQALAAALATLLSPGDELLVPTPSYFPFLNLPKVLGINPVYAPLQPPGWRPDIRELESRVTPKTRAILICHPNNPTGTVYTRAEIEGILKIARRHDLWVLVDEVYRYFTFGAPYTSIGEFKKDRGRVVRIMSFSKAFSLSGWRIGYLLAADPVVNEIAKVHEMMVTASASLPAQYAAFYSLDKVPDLPLKFREILSARGRRMQTRLEKLSDHFEFAHPQGAYYFFVRIKGGEDDVSFARDLLEEAGVAVVPGTTFGEAGRGHLRFSFAAKEGEIDEAFDRMERYLLGTSGPRIKVQELISRATGITDDSRNVEAGNIFVAVRGAQHDGHAFIREAFQRGASFAVGEQELNLPNYQRVGESRSALGQLCSAWSGHPSRRLQVIGVTGTDGKTTTTHLLGELLNRAGIKTRVLSTINVPGVHTTTPPAPILHRLLKEALEDGCAAAVLEVTSHALAQDRIAGVKFAGAVLTNVTPEHLDYHQDFARYRDTKARLFKLAPLAVVNRDDPSFKVFKEAAAGRTAAYSIKSRSAEFSVRNLALESGGSSFELVTPRGGIEINLPLPGEYNVQNALAAAAAASLLSDLPLAVIKEALEGFDPADLTGRFDRISEIKGPQVVVDFAHTPAALGKVLNHAARFKSAGGRLVVVFGAAGERDREKRPKMGEVAARTADLAVLTSEDPRGEDPREIIDEIARGCFSEGAVEGKNFVRIPDRRRAIRFALKKARKNDLVLVLGKGHETTMAIGEREHPWSDREVVLEEFRHAGE